MFMYLYELRDYFAPLNVFRYVSFRAVMAMITALLLFLNFPNIYRVKVDLGLTDDEMKSLYGDKYISGNEQQ